VVTLAVVLLSATLVVAPVAAGQATPAADGGDFPPGVSLEPVEEGTEAEVLAVAERVAVTRLTQEPGASTTRAVRHPTVFLVESGELTFVAGDAEGDEPATLLRAGDEQAEAKVVTPGSRLTLVPGDRLVVPPTPPDFDPDYQAFGNRGSEPAMYLEVEVFPSGLPSAALFEDSDGFAVEPLDVALGIQTAQEPAPPSVEVGCLTLDASAELPLDGLGPALLIAEQGALGLRVAEGSAPVVRAGADYDDAPEAVSAESDASLAPGDAVFVPPGTAGTLTAAQESAVSVVAVTAA